MLLFAYVINYVDRYVANIVIGATAAVLSMRKTQAFGNTANLLATIAYVVVTILLFQPFRPVRKRVSLVAAFCSFLGCIAAFIDMFGHLPKQTYRNRFSL